MVLVDNIEVRTDETHTCLNDLLKLAKCSIRSSNYKTILRQVKKRQSEVKMINKEIWVTYKFASELFIGYECSKLINDLPKASTDPSFKLSRPARRMDSESRKLIQQELEQNALKSSQDSISAKQNDAKYKIVELSSTPRRPTVQTIHRPSPQRSRKQPRKSVVFEPELRPERAMPVEEAEDVDMFVPQNDEQQDQLDFPPISLQKARDTIIENPSDLKFWKECLEQWPDYHTQKSLYQARVGASIDFLGDFVKFEYCHNNYAATVELLKEMTETTPNDATMWLFIADVCLAHDIDNQDELLTIGIKYMANGTYCKERIPYILKASEYLRRKPKRTFSVLVAVNQVMKHTKNWTLAEIDKLRQIIGYLFELSQHQYEPDYPQKLSSIEMLPDIDKPLEAQRLIEEYMAKSEDASTSDEPDERLFYMNIMDGLMDRYFANLPPANSDQETWSRYVAVWTDYIHALRRHQVDSGQIFELYQQLYLGLPQYSRDKVVVDYSQALFDAGHVDEALDLLSEWVDSGHEFTHGFRKKVLHFYFCILIDASRVNDRFEVLRPYLLRFRNDGQIWAGIIRFEYRVGETSIARSLAELALQVVEGSSREYIWKCYLDCDKDLTTEMHQNILARYFQEFKTTQSITMLSEFYSNTYDSNLGEEILNRGVKYQQELQRQLAVDEQLRML